MLLLQGFVGLHRTVQLQLLQHFDWGIDLDYCDIEWFVLETNRDHSVIFEIASKYCISDSFADCVELWLYIFGCKEYNQSDFGVDHLVMSMCRVFSCVVGRGCLL